MDDKQRRLITLAGLVGLNVVLALGVRSMEGSLQWITLSLMFVLTMLAFRVLSQLRSKDQEGDGP